MTENISVKAEKELKVPETQESRYSFVKEPMSTRNMEGLESVASMVGKVWSENDLNIMDIKNVIPYLMSMAFIQAGDSDLEILDYIDNYVKPAVFEYNRIIRNRKKFLSFEFQGEVNSIKK
ncbi:hypothetical protein OXIME_001679 [Oxyplasma meridianum]|uniref:Uncharacterized protein n=1 Tax=Oxyplasma meridianum TaxID=3073602 RepID=A0AAX4NIM9_9ARCH